MYFVFVIDKRLMDNFLMRMRSGDMEKKINKKIKRNNKKIIKKILMPKSTRSWHWLSFQCRLVSSMQV